MELTIVVRIHVSQPLFPSQLIALSSSGRMLRSERRDGGSNPSEAAKIAMSSNGRTLGFEPKNGGSTPPVAANLYNLQHLKIDRTIS